MAKRSKLKLDAALFGRLQDILSGASQTQESEKREVLLACKQMLKDLGQNSNEFKKNVRDGLEDALARAHEVSKDALVRIAHTEQCFSDTRELSNRINRLLQHVGREEDILIVEKFSGSFRSFVSE